MSELTTPDLSKDSVKTPLTAEAVADCEDFVRFHLGERGRAFQETLLEALAMARSQGSGEAEPEEAFRAGWEACERKWEGPSSAGYPTDPDAAWELFDLASPSPPPAETVSIGRNITFIPESEESNAVISPELSDGLYWTLIAQGGVGEQNAIAEEIVRRLNAPPPAEIGATVEEIARLIDPDGWARADACAGREGVPAREVGAWLDDSMTKAKAIRRLSTGGAGREPGATEAFDALDVADRLLERAYGDEMPPEWSRAYCGVAMARASAAGGA